MPYRQFERAVHPTGLILLRRGDSVLGRLRHSKLNSRQDSGQDAEDQLWNHSIHYHDRLVESAGSSKGVVLDAGCGTGMLSRQLAKAGHNVVGIDASFHSLSIATAKPNSPSVSYLHGDLLRAPLAEESFDAVVSVAMLHHIGTLEGLNLLARHVKPGGSLALVGLARSSGPGDLLFDCLGHLVSRVQRLFRVLWWDRDVEIVWPPPETYSQVRRAAEAALPGCQFKRHVLFRYSLVWEKPIASLSQTAVHPQGQGIRS